VAAVVVVLAGTLGTLWLRGWGRVGFEVPSMPWYFSFPFYVFPGPQLELGWTAATLPVVAATLAAHRGLVQRSASWTVAGGSAVGLVDAHQRGRAVGGVPGRSRLRPPAA
jgi:hypothetical protein